MESAVRTRDSSREIASPSAIFADASDGLWGFAGGGKYAALHSSSLWNEDRLDSEGRAAVGSSIFGKLIAVKIAIGEAPRGREGV